MCRFMIMLLIFRNVGMSKGSDVFREVKRNVQIEILYICPS